MLTNIPTGVMRPELVKTVLYEFKRKHMFRLLEKKISKLRREDRYLEVKELQRQQYALFPECISMLRLQHKGYH